MIITLELLFLLIFTIILYYYFNNRKPTSYGDAVCFLIGIILVGCLLISSIMMMVSLIPSYTSNAASFSDYQREYNIVNTYFEQNDNNNYINNPFLYNEMTDRAINYNENVLNAQNMYDNPLLRQYSRAWAKELNLINLPNGLN